MRLISTLLFVLAFSLCYSQYYRGLGHTQTTDLTIYNDTIYASTYDGIYKQGDLYYPNTNWIPCGMQGRHVVQTFVPNHQTFICLVEIDSTNTTQIYKSTNGGASFNLMNTDTSDFNSYPLLNAMAHPHGNYDTLYFLNHHLKTYDGGITWDTIHSQLLTDRFIAVNPNNHNELFIGGETMIFSPYLQSSPDRGDTWNLTMMNGFFAGDNCVHDLDFYNDTMYAAGEGVICRTIDGGNNWDQLMNTWSFPPNFSLYNWDIEVGNYGIYVTGSNSISNVVPLIWAYSFGSFWDTLAIAPFDGMNPLINCMKVIGAPFGEDVFLGGHGIYVYNIIMGGVNENQRNRVRTYPNPFHDYLNVELENVHAHNYTLSIFNSIGQSVINEILSECKSTIDMRNLSQGLYFVQVSDEKGNRISNLKCVRN